MEMFSSPVNRHAAQRAAWAVESGRLSEGPVVREFEQALSRELGLRNPVCTNSGTSALHLGMVLAGVVPGDEVILPAQTFIATGMAVLYCGAKPVFADIDPRTGLLDVEDVRRRLTENTKAVVPVHWLGLPAEVPRIWEVSSGVGAGVVQDAAQALGATIWDRPVCHWSDCMYSFQSTKHLTTGDGGCLAGLYYEYDADMIGVAEVRRLRWFGFDRNNPPGELGDREDLVEEAAYKYHLNDLAAAVGLGSLEGFKDRLARRQAIGARYRRELAGVPGVTLLDLPTDRTHAYYAFGVRVERRTDFVKAMKTRGVPCSVISRRIDRHPAFGGLRCDLVGTDVFDREQINLPAHDQLSDADVDRVVAAVKGGW